MFILLDSAAKARELLYEVRPHVSPRGSVDILLSAALTNIDYGDLCEIMDRSVWPPQIFNCAAPGTGNMEVTPARETRGVHVHVDLGKEGKANKISCRQRDKLCYSMGDRTPLNLMHLDHKLKQKTTLSFCSLLDLLLGSMKVNCHCRAAPSVNGMLTLTSLRCLLYKTGSASDSGRSTRLGSAIPLLLFLSEGSP